jgi:hypothetical protein
MSQHSLEQLPVGPVVCHAKRRQDLQVGGLVPKAMIEDSMLVGEQPEGVAPGRS